MSSNFKSAGVANLDAIPGFYRVAIVGAGSLKGKEVAEVLEQRNFPSSTSNCSTTTRRPASSKL